MQMSANPGPHWLDADDSTGHAKHADAPASRETAGQGPLPQLSEDGIDLQGRRTAAFKRYLDQLFPQPLEAETRASALEPFEALQRYLQLDRRMLALMPRTLPGQADELVVEEARTLRGLCRAAGGRALRRDLQPPADPPEDGSVRRVRRAGRRSLRDDDRAMAFYREAVPLFHDADALDDVRRLEMKIDEIARHRSSDFDVEIATLRGRLSEEGLSALERAEALISLGELYLRGGDTYAAAAPLQKAEGLLDTRCGGNPGPDALAQALMGSMRGIMDGSQHAGGSDIERVMQIRGLYTKLYAALSEALEGADREQAEHYHRLAEDIDSQAKSQDFGGAATSLMFGEYADLFNLNKRS